MATDKPAPKNKPIQPELLGVPAPKDHTGPWPPIDADGGDPSTWTTKPIKKEQ